MIGVVTVEELADVMTSAGRPVTAAALRYHCRDPRGLLYGIAYRPSGHNSPWLIPALAADKFAAQYERYGSLRKRGAGHPLPDAPSNNNR